MGESGTILLWLRRDFRLADHPALAAAAASGRPVIPVFVLDPVAEVWGAAPRWRLGEALAAFAAALDRIGARLVLRRGAALDTLLALIAETGATAVYWSRDLDPAAKARDTAVKAALKAAGVEARSFPGQVLFDPWTVETGQGGPYRVYTPYWKAVRGRDPGAPLPPVTALRPPATAPASEALADWRLGAAMNRGAAVVARHAQVGEAAALARLDRFLETGIDTYAERRDLPAEPGTSGLSENLAWGEISARTIWRAGWRAMDAGAAGAETFLKELVWRDFAWHLMYHFPELGSRNWRPEWDAFPWQGYSPAA